MLSDLQAILGDGPVVGNGAYGPPHDEAEISFAMIEEFSPLRDGARAIALLLFAVGTCRHVHLISGTFWLRRGQGEPDGSIQWRAKWPRNTGAKAASSRFHQEFPYARYLPLNGFR